MKKIKWTGRSTEVSIGTWNGFTFVVVQLSRDAYRVFRLDKPHFTLSHVPFPQSELPFHSQQEAEKHAQWWVDNIVYETKNAIT